MGVFAGAFSRQAGDGALEGARFAATQRGALWAAPRYERNYKLLFVEDAMAAMNVEEHDRAIKYIFPRMGIVRSTAEVLAAMRWRTCAPL
jgi:hypothetical protein